MSSFAKLWFSLRLIVCNLRFTCLTHHCLYVQSDSSIESGPCRRQDDELDAEEEEMASQAFKRLDDLPLEAVLCKTKTSFSSAARRHFMGLFPHATSGEINQIVTKKWQVLKDTTKAMPDELESYLAERQGKQGTVIIVYD